MAESERYFSGYYNQSPGISSVGSYQVAGMPYITGSTVGAGLEMQIKFPAIPRSITIINKDAANDDLRVHFAAKATGNTITGNHFITLDAKDSSVTINVKAQSIYLSAPGGACDFQLFAELTGIATEMMADLNIASFPGVSE